MNTQTIKGDWHQLKGKIKEAFGKLTDDDLMVAEGNAEQLVGAIQKRYGYTREQADEAWDAFKKRDDGAQSAGERLDDVVDELRDAVSPYDPNHAARTPDEALARELAQADAHNARREF